MAAKDVKFGVDARDRTNPTGEWIAHQVTEAFPWDSVPRYLIRDRDTSYGPVFVQRLHAMGIRDRPIASRPRVRCRHRPWPPV